MTIDSENHYKASDPEIESRIRSAPRSSDHFIGGRSVAPSRGQYEDNVCPATGESLGKMAIGDSADIDEAVASARQAQSDWRWRAPADRRAVLVRFAESIEAHADELAALDSGDVGKPYGVTRSVDVNSAIRTMRWYAELTDKLYGDVAPTAGLDVVVKEPMGVVGAIVPWNYPLMITAWKLGPMLAAGNSVVLKPSENSPSSGLYLAKLAIEAGLPPGLLNCVTGPGSTGAALAAHPGVRAIGFTGSTATGKQILTVASGSTLKAVSLECGGKTAFIVLPDADPEDAAAKLASGLFYNAGQSCNAPTRLLVHRSLSDRVVEALIAQAPRYMPNNPYAADVQVGAIVSQRQLERVSGFVDRAVAAGADVVYGGQQVFTGSGGFYYAPTILTNIGSGSEIATNEVFGPVLPVEIFESRDEALALANGTNYGLWANVMTQSLEAAMWFGRRLEAGTVGVNMAFGGDITTPLGGYKESGLGRDRGLMAVEKYQETKVISFPAT